MRKIYVAGLYSRNQDGSVADVIGVIKNIQAGIKESATLLRLGFAVFCPWLDFQLGLQGEVSIPKEMYQKNSMAWLEASDAVYVISGEGIGHGVDREIARAKELNIPIYRTFNELAEAELIWPFS